MSWSAPFQSSAKNFRRPENHFSLNGLWSARSTLVPLRNSFTASAGMMKLKPWTMLPSAPGERETKVRTPTMSPRAFTAGPPEFPHAAGASVWMTD